MCLGAPSRGRYRTLVLSDAKRASGAFLMRPRQKKGPAFTYNKAPCTHDATAMSARRTTTTGALPHCPSPARRGCSSPGRVRANRPKRTSVGPRVATRALRTGRQRWAHLRPPRCDTTVSTTAAFCTAPSTENNDPNQAHTASPRVQRTTTLRPPRCCSRRGFLQTTTTRILIAASKPSWLRAQVSTCQPAVWQPRVR